MKIEGRIFKSFANAMIVNPVKPFFFKKWNSLLQVLLFMWPKMKFGWLVV